ncbi:MAG: ABC transporter ATP-binding protein [Spirochaetes bacterium]|jgi:ABC-type cobalamin/Fe3+-siderophores transport system ATPase subunit|nr:ABC transporter ATP-binding protein [Spirochaetota bacterium]
MKIDSLCYSINQTKLLDNISFSLMDGAITALIGTSGSGKSILLEILAGELQQTEGIIFYHKEPACKKTRKKICSLYPDPTLEYSPYHSIRELIVMNIPKSGLTHKDNYEQSANFMHALCSYLHLLPYLDAQCGEVPDCVLKKSYLAACFAADKPICILDNPDSSLDPLSQTELINVIRHISSERSTRIIMASHNINFLFTCCTHFMALKKGSAIHTGQTRNVKDVQMEDTYGTEIICNRNVINGAPEFHYFHQV